MANERPEEFARIPLTVQNPTMGSRPPPQIEQSGIASLRPRKQSGIESLLGTLAPEDAKIVESWLTQDSMAALGAEAVGIRAIRLREDTYRSSGWAPTAFDDITEAHTREQIETGRGMHEPHLWAIKDWIRTMYGDKEKNWEGTTPYDETIRDSMFDERGILRPYVAYGGGVKKTMTPEEKRASYLKNLYHELRHIGDDIVARQASVDDDIIDEETGKPIKYDLTFEEKYDPNRALSFSNWGARGIEDEPYSRMVDDIAAKDLEERGLIREPSTGTEWTRRREKHGYIPERYPGDPFAGRERGAAAGESDPLQHPAQEAALFELLRRRNEGHMASDLRDLMTKIRADKSQKARDAITEYFAD